MENPTIIVIESSEEEERNGMRKREERRRWKLDDEEHEIISDLSGFPNLRAMVETEAFMRSKKRRRRRKKRRSSEVEEEPRGGNGTTTTITSTRSEFDEYREIPDLNVDICFQETDAAKENEKENPIALIASSEEEGNGRKGKRRKRNRRMRLELDEYEKISDLSGFPNVKAMTEAEAFLRRKNERKASQLHNELKMDSQVILTISSEEEEGSRTKEKKRKRNKRTISKLDKYEKISDLSGFPNLKAMIEAEAFLRRKNKNNIEASQLNKELKMDSPVILTTHSEEKEEGNGSNDKRRECNKRTISKLDKYEKISDLSRFPNLKDMIEAEAFLRRKNKSNIEASQLNKELKMDLPVILTTRSEEKEEGNGSNDKRRECGTKRSEHDEFRENSDLIGFDNLKDMIEAEASMWRKKRSHKKRSKKKRNVVFCAQEEVTEHAAKEKGHLGKDKVAEIVEVSNAESVQISEIDVPQNLVIDAAKEKEDAGTVKAVETTMVIGAGDVVNSVEVITSLSSPDDDATVYDVSLERGVEDTLPAETVVNGMKKRGKKIKMITKKDMVGNDSKEENNIKDNGVLQMLLRKPRYFDPPICDWGPCSNCGKENHTAASCKVQKQNKSCFNCGSFGHIWKYCRQGKDCFVRQGRNHPGNNLSSTICLRCGDPGHDMFSCRADYPADDLKAIQCCVCKNFGHLCCGNFSYLGHRKQVSCYNCGQSGHMGPECIKSRWNMESSIICYKCGKEGHYAQRCSTRLVWQRPGYLSSTAERSRNETRNLPESMPKPCNFSKALGEIKHGQAVQ